MLNKLLHSLLDGKICNEQRHVLDRHPNRSNDHPTVCDQDSVRICSLDVNMNNIDCAAHVCTLFSSTVNP